MIRLGRRQATHVSTPFLAEQPIRASRSDSERRRARLLGRSGSAGEEVDA